MNANHHNNDMCTIYDNLNGPGYRIQQTNSGFLRQAGLIYPTRETACTAAAKHGYHWYFATWHHDTSYRPRRIPTRFRRSQNVSHQNTN